MKDIKLHHRRVPVIGEIEEWKHGSWYHSNKIFCEDLPTLLEKLGDYSDDEITDIGNIGPQRSFWVRVYHMIWSNSLNQSNFRINQIKATCWEYFG